jgi:hypothetical protein
MYVTLLGDAVNKFIAGENKKITKLLGFSVLAEREVFKNHVKGVYLRTIYYAAGGLRSPDLQISQSCEYRIVFLNPMSLAP